MMNTLPDTATQDLIATEIAAADTRESRVTRRVGLGVAALAAIGVAVGLSGVWTPRLTYDGSAALDTDRATRTGVLTLTVRNTGLVPAEVRGPASTSVPGLDAISATTNGVVAPGAQGRLVVRLRVADCAALRPGGPVDAAAGADLRVTVPTWRGDTLSTLREPMPTILDAVRDLCS